MSETKKDPFVVFERWLEWLTSYDGRLYRRAQGQKEDDFDLLCTIPTPPGSSILTVGDLRDLVECGKELRRLRGNV